MKFCAEWCFFRCFQKVWNFRLLPVSWNYRWHCGTLNEVKKFWKKKSERLLWWRYTLLKTPGPFGEKTLLGDTLIHNYVSFSTFSFSLPNPDSPQCLLSALSRRMTPLTLSFLSVPFHHRNIITPKVVNWSWMMSLQIPVEDQDQQNKSQEPTNSNVNFFIC